MFPSAQIPPTPRNGNGKSCAGVGWQARGCWLVRVCWCRGAWHRRGRPWTPGRWVCRGKKYFSVQFPNIWGNTLPPFTGGCAPGPPHCHRSWARLSHSLLQEIQRETCFLSNFQAVGEILYCLPRIVIETGSSDRDHCCR